MSVKEFDRGIDFAGAAIDLNDAKKNSASFILRYSAGAASSPAHGSYNTVKWKLCGLDEIQRAVNAGLDFIANSEWYESRVTEGYNAGHADGLTDLDFWKSRGLAKGSAVYYSWDQGQPDASKHAALGEYFRGVADAFGGYYSIGLYAGDVAINAMLDVGRIQFGWLAMAGSWSKPLAVPYQPGGNWLDAAKDLAPKTRACIWQNGNRWYNDGADEDVILRVPVGSHLEAQASPIFPPTPIPAPQPSSRPAPGPAVSFPLPQGYYFGYNTGPYNSISGWYGERYNGRLATEWLQMWANQMGARGWDVGKGRTWLGQFGNDGKYGSEYDALARAFQRNQGLTVDGEIGPNTWWAAYHNPVS